MLAKTQTDVHTPVDSGPLLQVFLSAATLGLTAPGTSPVLLAGGYPKLAVGATSSAAGSIAVQRYLDAAATIPQGAALSVSLTAATAGVLNVNDGLPFQSFTVTITGGALTNVGALLQSR